MYKIFWAFHTFLEPSFFLFFSACRSQEGRRMTYLPLLLVNELSCRVKDLMVGRRPTQILIGSCMLVFSGQTDSTPLFWQEINSSSSMQLPLTVSYEGISLRTFRFWIHLHDIVYSLRQFGEPGWKLCFHKIWNEAVDESEIISV